MSAFATTVSAIVSFIIKFIDQLSESTVLLKEQSWLKQFAGTLNRKSIDPSTGMGGVSTVTGPLLNVTIVFDSAGEPAPRLFL
jgi:hypothetical protein